MKQPFKNKKHFKLKSKKCYICENDDYDLLHTHRIKWGGSYSNENCVTLCCTCHTLVHRDRKAGIGKGVQGDD